MARVCIICEKEPAAGAYAVGDDVVVKAIRAVKKKLGIAKNNELYVCEPCLPAYKEKRKKFEKNLVLYVAIGVVIFVLLSGLQLFLGQFNPATFVASVVLAVMLPLLAVLNYEIPPLKDMSVMNAPPEQPAQKGGAKAAGPEEEEPAEEARKEAKKRPKQKAK